MSNYTYKLKKDGGYEIYFNRIGTTDRARMTVSNTAGSDGLGTGLLWEILCDAFKMLPTDYQYVDYNMCSFGRYDSKETFYEKVLERCRL